jgi:murein DD-endopeptidase MepM/ murein hydrolase activator NlpD
MLSWLITLTFATEANPQFLWRTENLAPSIIAQSPNDQNSQGLSCSPPVLSRLQRHKIAPGETIASIAQKYNLLTETLIRLNPVLQGGSAPVGREILIPPFNGVRVEVPAGATWKDLEAAYGVRADVLFELNGCQKTPKVVFIPGVNWTPRDNGRRNDYTGLKSYPLPQTAQIGLGYGWQKNSISGQQLFHSGIDLIAEPGTSVLSANDGIVAFVGQEGAYGNLVVIAHTEERQTRYAHLGTVQVKIGQQVSAGDVIGTVGTTGQPDIKTPHLHFEVRYKLPAGWVAQDPTLHLPARTSN